MKCYWSIAVQGSPIISRVLCLLLLLCAPGPIKAEPTPAAAAAFNAYIAALESSLSHQHASADGFIAPTTSVAQADARPQKGEFLIEKVTPSPARDVPGAMLHHWRGTVFAPGVTAADFERLMKNFGAYPQIFAPDVLQARATLQGDNSGSDHFRVWMRVRQHHVITVVLDTTYDVTFGHLDPQHGYSISRSTNISEIESPGTKSERALSPSEEHGFLWRLNTYWTYEERDGGLYMQIETVSLTRSIPPGLGWVIRPFIESIPRESLESTLRSASTALRSH